MMCAACTNNDCKDCVPPAKQCSDPHTSQVCESNGHWGTTTPCPLGCTGGECWVCTPGDAPRCSPTLPDTPQTCMSGQWANGTACVSPSRCVGGACVECEASDPPRCNVDRPETCVGGHWQIGAPCPNGCMSGQCTEMPEAGAGR
jgi:hypothetical protein